MADFCCINPCCVARVLLYICKVYYCCCVALVSFLSVVLLVLVCCCMADFHYKNPRSCVALVLRYCCKVDYCCVALVNLFVCGVAGFSVLLHRLLSFYNPTSGV